jgi:hypothetical protein
MAQYIFAHPSASATRVDMEFTVAKFGGIRVRDYQIAKLVVETEAATAEKFQQKYPAWIIRKDLTIPQSPRESMEEMTRHIDRMQMLNRK